MTLRWRKPSDASAFVVVQDIFLTETAKMADVVLPALPYTEREGTYHLRRTTRSALLSGGAGAPGNARADFAITARDCAKDGPVSWKAARRRLVLAADRQIAIPRLHGFDLPEIGESPAQ